MRSVGDRCAKNHRFVFTCEILYHRKKLFAEAGLSREEAFCLSRQGAKASIVESTEKKIEDMMMADIEKGAEGKTKPFEVDRRGDEKGCRKSMRTRS